MATFLELAQKVGSDSGTVQGNQPTTVAVTNDRLRKIVRWTNDAYRQIQNAHRAWLWLQGEFEGDTTAGVARYTGAALNADRLAEWGDRESVTLFDPAVGPANEGPLIYRDWLDFYRNVLRGAQTPGRPRYFSVSPAGELVLAPTPDRAFTVRGLYRKAPQTLALDDDVPDMPAHFHDCIVEAAVIMLSTHDEAAPNLTLWQLRAIRGFSQLEREQLPTITMAGPLC